MGFYCPAGAERTGIIAALHLLFIVGENTNDGENNTAFPPMLVVSPTSNRAGIIAALHLLFIVGENTNDGERLTFNVKKNSVEKLNPLFRRCWWFPQHRTADVL